MIKYINGDLFDHIPETPSVIAHVCNDGGVWEAGFFIPLAQHYPEAKEQYLRNDSRHPAFKLGQTLFVEVVPNYYPAAPIITVANMVAQTLDVSRPLHYNALVSCMDRVANFMLNRLRSTGSILCPMFGIGSAGGNWNVIEKLIEDCWLRQNIEVTVFIYPHGS